MNSDGLLASLANLPVIGVAIGLIFTYLITSLVASAVKEAIAGVFQWRGTYLQQGIGVLLSNVPGTGFSWGGFSWAGLVNWLVAHFTWIDPTGKVPDAVTKAAAAADAAGKALAANAQVVASKAAATLANADAAAVALVATATKAVDDARTLAGNAATAATQAAQNATPDDKALATGAADAAQQTVAAVTSGAATALAQAESAIAAVNALLRVRGVQTHPLVKGTPTKLPSYVPSRDFATAMLDVLRDGSRNPTITQIENTVAALPDGDIKQVLAAFIADAAGDLDKLRARIEHWFDDAMDRLSGIYKRFSQYFLLALGLLVAVVLNIDSVHLAIALWDQPALRAQIVAEAQIEAAKPSPDANQSVQQAVQNVQQLPLPVGRPPCSSFFGEPSITSPAKAGVAATATTPAQPPVCATALTYASGWDGWNGWTLLGWLVTGFSISLGAPFWFDLLQNFMNLRAAGTPPKRANGTPATS